MYGAILTLRTKLKIWLLEDLLEEMNDKAAKQCKLLKVFTLCTEYLLVNSPRIPWYDFKINNSNFNVFSTGRKEYLCCLYTWEFKHHVYLVVVAPLLCIVCDNPMASQL